MISWFRFLWHIYGRNIIPLQLAEISIISKASTIVERVIKLHLFSSFNFVEWGFDCVAWVVSPWVGGWWGEGGGTLAKWALSAMLLVEVASTLLKRMCACACVGVNAGAFSCACRNECFMLRFEKLPCEKKKRHSPCFDSRLWDLSVLTSDSRYDLIESCRPDEPIPLR